MDRTQELHRTARRALIGAAAMAVGLGLTWLGVFHVGYVQHVDAEIFNGFSGLQNRPYVTPLCNAIAALCDPFPYVLLCALPVGIALRRHRPLLAVVILAVLLGANVTTELLKSLTAAPRPGGLPLGVVDQASWPSGHATASMALALCTVLACPARLRPRAAVAGAAFAIAVSFAFLTLGWHYPSDALAGFLMASMWTLLGVAAFTALGARAPGVTRIRPARIAVSRALAPPALAVAGALLVGVCVLVARPEVLSYARSHPAFVVGAAALAALGIFLATGMLVTIGGLSGSDPGPRAVPRRRWRRG